MSFAFEPPPELEPAVGTPALEAERLGPRLLRVAMNVPEGARVVDVGSDHARLVIALVRSERCPTAIAVDVAAAPYERARRAVAAAALSHRIAVRRGDGLAPIESAEADVAVLAGFGGRTACGVIAGAPDRMRRLVIQANRDVPSVREALVARRYRLVHEELVFDDGRAFVILVAEPGDEALDRSGVWLGPRLLEARAPLFLAYLEWRRAHLDTLAARGQLSGPAVEERAVVARALARSSSI